MFKFFKNKRYYRKNWTGEIIDSEILVRGEFVKVKIYPYEIKKRNGWLDVEWQYMEYFIKAADVDKGYHIQADGYTDALYKLTRYMDGEGIYIG
ncbi:hypothetical protein BCPG3_143 [Bacillus phage BCPG3]|uniref:Uncharacterized protein n=1 Tax=Bacillus phage BPS10C TaxID=1277886 RepID=W5QUC4_9CAUD|nr:hypothetical protein BPS10C_158 [Bacillus phage BPS10C]AGI12155.1 hypothetical protein BPS10C_158 [Bacillus phage BPS10C]QQO38849.1 hypothetical protein BCPG1_118 [Bacillus phage BCPG1]QSJ04460.1 hypothetical protein BCPG3_143 [Bacillus phage BCPG3]QSJ04670.1 hypothetical protein BCP18_138 [Bacillus phage BCP18]